MRKMFKIILMLSLLIGCSHIEKKSDDNKNYSKVSPVRQTIKDFVSTTGEILPENRVEIKAPLSGRIEQVLVKEGDNVKKGDILMYESSTERAALLDTASSQGEAKRKYWENLYKPIPIIAPISGEIIVRNIEPGQSADVATAIMVISNKLIIKANVDETDIGRVKLGQKAIVSLDAYPDVKAVARVSHIAFESTIVNNVTTYLVEITPKQVPKVFRSGMSANIEIIVEEKPQALLIPTEAIMTEDDKSFVLIGDEKVKTLITTGLTSGDKTEVLSGVNESDCLMVKNVKITSKTNKKKNPFMPQRPDRKKS